MFRARCFSLARWPRYTLHVNQAWTNRELADPHQVTDKAQRVRAMFSAIAPSYDLNNRLHSLWRDQAWRRAAVKMAQVRPGDRLLDVACGTGDLTLAFARRLRRLAPLMPGQITGLDFTLAMLPLAQRKQPASMPIGWINGDAMALPVRDGSVDVVSIAFGIRNVASPARAMQEFFRVLRPGGRLVILEFSVPRNPVLRWLNHVYCGRVMPRTATLIARDRSGAYRYLPRSVDTFFDPPTMLRLMHEAGGDRGVHRSLTLGMTGVYVATKP